MTPVHQRVIALTLSVGIVAPLQFGVAHASPGERLAPRRGSAGVDRGIGAPAAPAYGTYRWPVSGVVIRGFEPPPGPYQPGHRGIDIAAAFGTILVAAQDGVVAFAGWIGGSLFVSIDHPDGVRTTYSWLSAITVHRGEAVTIGQPIGATGHGHPDVPIPHLHFGARVGDTYIDPMLLLSGGSVSGLIHLAPLG
jgi:murein DD-endopeptidase MepM/ murein hydrolase activator NlpD